MRQKFQNLQCNSLKKYKKETQQDRKTIKSRKAQMKRILNNKTKPNILERL